MRVLDLGEATARRFQSLGRRESVRTAANAFATTGLGLITICDEGGRALGVVSKSDLVRHLAGAGPVEASVSEVMSRTIVSAHLEDNLRPIWELMLERQLQNLPLLDAERRPVGTLDIRDALAALIALEEQQEGQLINYIAGIGYR